MSDQWFDRSILRACTDVLRHQEVLQSSTGWSRIIDTKATKRQETDHNESLAEVANRIPLKVVLFCQIPDDDHDLVLYCTE